jgi:plastocyanin
VKPRRSGRWLAHPPLAPLLVCVLVVLVATTRLAVNTALASQALISVTIIDDPRPVEKWGYAPTNRKVPVGSWVTWSNDGYEAHSVTALNGAFDSGTLNPSEGFSWYFDEDGTYKYVCSLHDWMVGTIVVGSGEAPAPTDPPSDPTEDASEQ